MKIRSRIAAVAAAASLSLLATPAAQAQQIDLGTLIGGIGIGDQVVSGVLASASCSQFKTALDQVDRATPGQLYNKDTTRNQLQSNLRALGAKNDNLNQGPLAIALVRYSGQAADKALACGIVKKDPTFGPFGDLSSKVNDYAPLLENLSSQAAR